MVSVYFGLSLVCVLVIVLGEFVYYESLNRDLKTKPINERRCDERLQTRVEESTRLGCPQLFIMNR